VLVRQVTASWERFRFGILAASATDSSGAGNGSDGKMGTAVGVVLRNPCGFRYTVAESATAPTAEPDNKKPATAEPKRVFGKRVFRLD